MSDRLRGAGGQALPLALVALLFATLVALGVARVGAATARSAAAQAAADATALAAVADGEAAAASVADANGAQLIDLQTDGDDVVVRVERHGATATARARWLAVAIP